VPVALEALFQSCVRMVFTATFWHLGIIKGLDRFGIADLEFGIWGLGFGV
jgi:hypothetical protein